MNKNNRIQQVTRSAVLIALGLILPYLFHSVQDAGKVFLPMHIPVLLGGFVLSPVYAMFVGIVTPILSNLTTGMPPFPYILAMIFELAAYGITISVLFSRFKLGLYPSLLLGMLLGRIANILASYFILHLFLNNSFSLRVLLVGLFMKGLPGIVIQIILVPLMVSGVRKISKEDCI